MTRLTTSADFSVPSKISWSWPLLVVALVATITVFQVDALSVVIAIGLITLSFWHRWFWVLVIPCLICFSGMEKTVFLDRTLSFQTPLNQPLFPDLWLTCFGIRVIAYWAQLEQCEST